MTVGVVLAGRRLCADVVQERLTILGHDHDPIDAVGDESEVLDVTLPVIGFGGSHLPRRCPGVTARRARDTPDQRGCGYYVM